MLQLADDILVSVALWRERDHPLSDGATRTINEITDAAKTIMVCARHQKRIVDDVLTLSKMDLTNMMLKPSPIQIEDLVNHAVKILEADAAASNIKVAIVQEQSIKSLGLKQIVCDSLRITQILINLLSNAIKFTRLEANRNIKIHYGAALEQPRMIFPNTIRWASSRKEQLVLDDILSGVGWGNGKYIYLTFQIEDTGLGMNEEEMQRVFDRFEQASPQTSIKYGGSGLGLFICRSLSQSQCGGIGMSSNVGKGTTIAFYVACRDAAIELTQQAITKLAIEPNDSADQILRTTHLPDMVQALPSIAQIPVKSDKTTKHCYQILLVEDNIINQRILSKQLTRAGCSVSLANHGVEALEFLKGTAHWCKEENDNDCNSITAITKAIAQPVSLDVILMDLNMPIMDGLTCTTQIRALEHTGALTTHLEIIVVTANARNEQTEQALLVGADAVLRKPFVVSELLELIEKRLSKRK